MATVTMVERRQDEKLLPATRVRIGMIIPSGNSLTEPQFNHFAPPGLGVHVARARVADEWKRPLAAMAEEIATSAKLLADVAPDLIVFHCTNPTQIEAIAEIEDALGKPVVNSNQAVLWGCVKRLKSALAPLPPMSRLGRLMRQLDA